VDKKEGSAWNTEVGLPNDFDGWISNPRFGFTEAYAAKVIAAPGRDVSGLQFIVDLVDAQGELAANAGWSVGSGWTPSEDGRYITHATRKNVVTGSMYANLQHRVTGPKSASGLEVDMDARGTPTDAKSWDGMGFHWMVEEHNVVSGPPKPGLMPTIVLTTAAPAVAASAKTEVAPDVIDRLKKMVASMSIKQFQAAAVRIPEVSKNEALTNQVLDDGPNGFYAQNKK